MSIKYRNKFQNIEQVTLSSIGSYFAQHGIYDYRLVSQWRIIARDFSKDFLPLKISKKKLGNGLVSILYLNCQNEYYPKSNLRYIKKDLIERINQFFGHKMVDDVAIAR